MTDQTDPAPPATTPAKTPKQYQRERTELVNLIYEMHHYAPSNLAPLLVVARSMMNANTEDSQ